MSLLSDSGYAGSSGHGQEPRSYLNQRQYFPAQLHSDEQYNYSMPGQYREYEQFSVSNTETIPDSHFQPFQEYDADVPMDPRLADGSLPPSLMGVGVNLGTPVDQMTINDIEDISPKYDPDSIPHIQTTIDLAISNDPSVGSPWTPDIMKRSQPSQDRSSQGGKRCRVNSEYQPTLPTNTSFYESSPGRDSQYPGSQCPPSGSSSSSYQHASLIKQQHSSYPQQIQSPYEQDTSPLALQHNFNQAQLSKTKTKRTNERKFNCREGCVGKAFKTINDLDRHRKSVHRLVKRGDKIFLCRHPECTAADKVWTRLDNFKQHVTRMHNQSLADEAESWCVLYNPAVHGRIEGSKGSKGGTTHASHQRSTSEHFERLSGHGTFNTDLNQATTTTPMSTSDQPQLLECFGLQGPLALITESSNPRQTNTFLMHHVDRSLSPNFATARGRLAFISPQHLHPSHFMDDRSPRRRISKTVAAPEIIHQQWQALQLEGSTAAVPANMVSSQAEFASIGSGLQQGLGVHFPEQSSGQSDQLLEGSHENATIQLTGNEGNTDCLSITLQNFLSDLPAEHKKRFLTTFQIANSTPTNSGQAGSGLLLKSLKNVTADSAKVAKNLRCDIAGCSKLFDKQSELKKHQTRHQRKFGCTFDHCYKRFGTKWEWKRHERNQHIQLQEWRCRHFHDQNTCSEHFDDEQAFVSHLKVLHNLTNEPLIATKLEESTLAKKWLGSFWCGFCEKIVKSKQVFGTPMTEERYNHISKHIDNDKYSMENWIELKGRGRTKKHMQKKDREGDLRPSSKGEFHREGKDAIDEEKTDASPPSSEDDDDVPGDDNESQATHSRTHIDTDVALAEREAPSTASMADRRRASSSGILTPTIQVTHVDQDYIMSNTHHSYLSNCQTSPFEDDSNTRLWKQPYMCCSCHTATLSELVDSPCPECSHAFCLSCRARQEMRHPQGQAIDQYSSYTDSGQSAEETIDMFSNTYQ